MNQVAQEDPDEKDPGKGYLACERMLDIIDRVLRSQDPPRFLNDDAKNAFREGDDYTPEAKAAREEECDYNPKGNAASFDANYSKQGWIDLRKKLIRAAKLHAKLCSMIADFDDPKGEFPEIDPDILRAAGKLVKFACPAITRKDRAQPLSGAWCDWP